jgi:isopentenyl-diphosphate delta-isomerase
VIVSSDDEALILCDAEGHALGTATKAACHDGAGLLHRALSVFLFNAAGEVLLQQRSASKRLWPLRWANSCCSHPRSGETTAAAAERRVAQELGLRARLHYLYEFEYHAHFGDAGSEHELCSVFHGRSDRDPEINATEIAAWKWVAPVEVDRLLREKGALCSPWLHLEWTRLRRDFWTAIA